MIGLIAVIKVGVSVAEEMISSPEPIRKFSMSAEHHQIFEAYGIAQDSADWLAAVSAASAVYGMEMGRLLRLPDSDFFCPGCGVVHSPMFPHN